MPHVSPEGADLEEVSNMLKVLDLGEFQSGIQTRQSGSSAYTLSLMPPCLPGDPITNELDRFFATELDRTV